MIAAAGFSIHTGRAAVVVIQGPPARVIEKFRIELADEAHDSRFVFHAASEHPKDAERLVSTAARIARERAVQALRKLGAETILALPPVKKALPDLARILASHPLLHAAEGVLYRNAIVEAGRALGYTVVTPMPSDDPEVGKQTAPWGKDQKDAASLAWAAILARGK